MIDREWEQFAGAIALLVAQTDRKSVLNAVYGALYGPTQRTFYLVREVHRDSGEVCVEHIYPND